jgi:ribose transport system permease protein
LKADVKDRTEQGDGQPGTAAIDKAPRTSPADIVRETLERTGSLVPLVALLIAATILVPGFTTKANLEQLLTQNATTGIVAAGMTLVIIGGAFDLSVGAIFALATVIYASRANDGSFFWAAVVTIAVCLLCGLVNGILVTRFRINSFVATLGSGLVFSGLAVAWTTNGAIYVYKPGFTNLGSSGSFGLQWSAWILIAVMVVLSVLLLRTVFGLHLSATGANFRAAQLVGVRTSLVQTTTFVIIAGLAGLAGMISSSQLASATGNVGSSLPLDAIAAVVIGGTSLSGGRGSVARTFAGVMIIGVLTNMFNSFGWQTSLQYMVKGAVIIIAVGYDAVRKRQASS